MKKTEYLIIGFGKAGKTLAARLGTEGHHVIVVEKDPKMYGGTCINVACIPTKALVEKAALSKKIGGSFEDKAKRYAEAMAFKETLTSALRGKNYHKLADNPNIQVLDGEGHFLDAHHVEVKGETIETDTIVINTGARPFVPPIEGIKNPHVYVSETFLNETKLPKRLVIVGGGYIGLEFASMYLNFGSEVTVIQTEPVFIGREDVDIQNAVEADFLKRGLTLIKNAQTQSFVEKEGLVTTTVIVNGEKKELVSEAVLVATGRRPNVESLDLAKAGVALTPRGAIQVDEHNRTNVPNIFAVGDVTGGLQFTYVSLDDYRIVYSALTKGPRTTLNRGYVPYSVFIDPPLSRLGLTEAEARLKGEVLVGQIPVSSVPKAHILGKTEGLFKVIVDKNTHLIVGAHLYGAESPELINQLKMAMDHKIPYEDLRDAIYTHPTMSEAFNDLFAAVK
jgi:pyruvate/2-oxoglutarate dehydrogenase complex dihydrolipoamide dehydrogenase (E3) component